MRHLSDEELRKALYEAYDQKRQALNARQDAQEALDAAMIAIARLTDEQQRRQRA